MLLKTSQSPPSEWTEILAGDQSSSGHSTCREAWIEGQHIVVDCVPDELDRSDLNDRKKTWNSNAKYRDHLARVLGQRQHNRQTEDAENRHLDDLCRKLDFSRTNTAEFALGARGRIDV